MQGLAALIEPSDLDWSEAKLSCQGRDGRAGIGVITRYEHGLPLPSDAWATGNNPSLSCLWDGAKA